MKKSQKKAINEHKLTQINTNQRKSTITFL